LLPDERRIDGRKGELVTKLIIDGGLDTVEVWVSKGQVFLDLRQVVTRSLALSAEDARHLAEMLLAASIEIVKAVKSEKIVEPCPADGADGDVRVWRNEANGGAGGWVWEPPTWEGVSK
jgi:hypothetical protein